MDDLLSLDFGKINEDHADDGSQESEDDYEEMEEKAKRAQEVSVIFIKMFLKNCHVLSI